MSEDLKTQVPETVDEVEAEQDAEGQETAAGAETPASMEEAEVGAAASVADLEQTLAKAKAEAAEYLEGWQRARAEFANYRKRVERERQEMQRHATYSVLSKLLPTMDDLERALGNMPEELAGHSWAQGITLIHQKLDSLLQNEGVVPINPLGEAFDPAYHEAVGTDDNNEVESGHITAVLQKGYIAGDAVLRPALVRVAS